MSEEIWKDIPGYPDLQASSEGRLRRVQIVTPKYNKKARYLRVHTKVDGRNKSVKVHHLVAAAFNGPRPVGYTVDHSDFDRLNNRPTNLEYVTIDENIRRAIAAGVIGARSTKAATHGKLAKAKAGCAKLTDKQAAEIKRLLPEMTMALIAKQFGVSAETIRLIRNGFMYRNV